VTLIESLATDNELTINSKKTSAMIDTARYINNLSLPLGTFSNCNSIEYLGLSITKSLSWNKQITKMSSRIHVS